MEQFADFKSDNAEDEIELDEIELEMMQVFAVMVWDSGHPQEPQLWPLSHVWVTIQSKVTIREILSLKQREYTWNTHVSHLEIV